MLPSRTYRVMCNSLDLALQLRPRTHCRIHMIILVLSNDRMSKMKAVQRSFCGLDLLERPPWSMLPLEATMVFVVHYPSLC